MKRLLALVLSIVVFLAIALPVQAFAANIDQALENAIKIAKTKFTIPSDYKFTSNLSTDGGTKKIFYLTWSSTDKTDTTNINVRIDENGMILGYDRYSQSDYAQIKKLPKFSREDARKKADAYIKNIDPALSSQLKYTDNVQANVMDASYYFTYYRTVNGIPFYNDQVSVNVNRETGALMNFNRNWTAGLTFPAAAAKITNAEAISAYKDNMGLKLVYKYTYADEKLKLYAVYIPVYDNNSYAIDAMTGERIQVYGGYYGPYYDVYNEKAMMSKAEGGDVTLNPDEQKAVQDAAKLKTEADAEKIARAAEFLGLTDDYKLSGYYLNTNYPVRDSYIWTLSFNMEDKEDSTKNRYVTVGIDANTGTIVNFYRGVPYQNVKAKYDVSDAKAAADEFLKKYYADTAKQMQYNEQYAQNIILGYGSEKPQNISLKYDRVANGAAFPDNGVNMDYDAVNGVISSFNLSWFNSAQFPSIDKAITLSDALSKLTENVGLELEYKTKQAEVTESAKIRPVPQQNNMEVKLVYVLKPGKPLAIDANTGVLLDGSGEPYKEVKPVVYTDIKGNAAEKQIKVLAENGVYLDGTEFKPGMIISQQDFMTLLVKTLGYYGPVITPKSSQKDIDDMYAYLVSMNILKPGEKAPASAVTREDAVKFIIRAMKYDKVADLQGIYICPFKDKAKIDKKLIGYATIAAGFKIVNGSGNFNPKTKLTRADAAVMLYNYLQI